MNASEIAQALITGEFSEQEIARIKRACITAEQIVGLSLEEGAEVVVKGGIRPQYLVGATGVVVGHKGDRILVVMDESNHHPKLCGRQWRMSPGSLRRREVQA